MAWFTGETLLVQFLSCVLLFLFAIFVGKFLVPALLLGRKLKSYRLKLSGLAKGDSPNAFHNIFVSDDRMAHLWAEYRETLHEQKEAHDGVMQAVAWRATIPAETYFNTQHIVDSRLGLEFFKHLPGIFTGVGIIGTFGGLINGLKDFSPSPDPTKTVAMVGPLIHAVHEAFFISASAIAAAMIATVCERLLTTWLYRQADDIAALVDRNFDMGAGEEYLARLTQSSEDSASQAKMLKDALIKELGDILREISQSQIHALQTANKDLGGSIVDSIKSGLAEPMSRLEDTFKQVTGGQGEQTVRMLNDIMVDFGQRLNDLFGGQIQGINELNRQSADTMKEAVASLNTLVSELGSSGQQMSDQMAAKMAEAMESMEQRQSDINTRMDAAIAGISEQMNGLMQSMTASHASSLSASREREEAMNLRSSGLIESLTGNVESVVRELAAASQSMAGSVDRLSSVASSSIDKMNLGADKIAQASSRFIEAGGKVGEVMDKAAAAGGKLGELSSQMISSSTTLREVIGDYQNQRQAVVALLDNAKETIAQAKKEAGLSGDILKRIEGSAEKLADVQADFDDYLSGISNVLVESSESFRDAVTSTLKNVNNQFHEDLARAVKLLSMSIQELDSMLGSR